MVYYRYREKAAVVAGQLGFFMSSLKAFRLLAEFVGVGDTEHVETMQ